RPPARIGSTITPSRMSTGTDFRSSGIGPALEARIVLPKPWSAGPLLDSETDHSIERDRLGPRIIADHCKSQRFHARCRNAGRPADVQRPLPTTTSRAADTACDAQTRNDAPPDIDRRLDEDSRADSTTQGIAPSIPNRADTRAGRYRFRPDRRPALEHASMGP